MKKLLVYLRDYKKETVLGPLFKLLEALFELLVPLIMASIIDKGISNGDKNYIVRMCLVLVGLGIIGLACSLTAQYFAAKASVGFVKQVRHALFAHIEDLSYSEIDTVGTSTLITRMTSDINQVQSGMNLTLRLLLRSPFIVFGAMIMAFTIDFKAALVFVAAIPILSVVVFGIMILCIPLYKKVQGALDRVLGITRENLTGVRVIRAFCKEKEEITIFEQRNESLTTLQKHVGRISALLNPMTYIIVNIAIVVLVWVGAIRVDTGVITQGAVVALYNYMSQILVELIKLANLIINITKSVACGNRIQSIFEIKSSLDNNKNDTVELNDNENIIGLNNEKNTMESGDSENNISDKNNFSENNKVFYRDNDALSIIEFNNVNFKYKNAADYSLSGVNFSVKMGETIGIIGGTGSGKSTLVNLIPRFYDCTEGNVKVEGIDVRDYTLLQLRQKVGVVPQKAVLFKGTIRDNMRWGKLDATDEEIYRALEIAQAKEIVDKKSGGLNYMIDQGGKNLSGGQRQRFTIARALVKKPEILILDDSASALDFATDAALRKAIANMQPKITVFIVSQRASSIQYADKIVVLDDGNVVGIGKNEDLLESCRVYNEIYYSQFEKGSAAR